MRPYNPYSNYTPGYNPCMGASYPQAMSESGAYVPMPEPVPMCPPGAVPYTVQEGDTLYSIARMYGTTVQELMAANPGIPDMNMIYIGQIICVPIPRPCAGQRYTVVAGDTFYSISRKFGVTVAELMAANPGIPAGNLIVGTVICIPTPVTKPCPTGSMTYTVVAGDTLTSIADRFSVSVYALTVANPGFSADNLMPGMRLCIAPFACTPACVESERYTVADGEDLMKIAAKFSVTTDALLKANPFAPPCYFAPGNMICLPATAVPPKPLPVPVPNPPNVPNEPNAPGGQLPGYSNMPNAPGGQLPGYSNMPNAPGSQMPGHPNMPNAPGSQMPGHPNMPNAPGGQMPGHSNMPNTPNRPMSRQ